MKHFGKSTATLVALLIIVTLASCGEKKFKIDGDVQGADGQSLVIEKATSSGSWLAMDSTRTDGSGRFSLSVPAPGAPEIFRLRSGDRYFYFPVDSTENITLHADGRGYTLDGSANARSLSSFETQLAALPATADEAALAAFKKKVFAEIIAPGHGNIVSYYVLTKTRDGKPLYDPKNPDDMKYFAAVATAYEQYRPDDPRAAMLKNIALEAQRNAAKAKGKKTVLKAQQIEFFDITLPDVDGRDRSLSEVVGKGKPAILVFTSMTAKFAPDYNVRLQALADRANIYMVSYDADRYDWRRAAQNLPWVNVFDENGPQSEILGKYNVTQIPVAFVFNAAGELTDRVADPAQLASKI